MALLDEILMSRDTTTIDDVIRTLTEIKNKHGNINVTLQYQDEEQAYEGHTPGIYAFYVENEGDGVPVVILE